ncbi:hypothetical protein K439DRAFT_807649 [Ramaria rubella]|nr:hypothetical protein K439DRAFT_804365 [Ramaria rubella]KAF8587546.1 hypothetical protein K439DRAFT_807649 [Ramaria rubella]
MSLGACKTRHFQRFLFRFKPSLFHRHASVHLDKVKTPYPVTYAGIEYIPAKNIRGNPLPDEAPLAEEEQLEIVRLLNQTSPRFPDLRSRLRFSPYDRDVSSSYLSLRLSPLSVQELTAEAYIRIAKEAHSLHLQHIMNMLAEDLLNHFPRESDPDGFSRAAIAILDQASRDCPLTPRRTLELYDSVAVSDPTRLTRLLPKAWDRIFDAALTIPESITFNFESFASTLLSVHTSNHLAYSRFTWIAYRAVIHILMQGEDEYPRALVVFQQLVKQGRIPKLAQEFSDGQGGSFKIVIATTLARACLLSDWYIRAAEFIIELLQDPRWSQGHGTTDDDVKATYALAFEVMQSLIRSPTKSETQMARRLIQVLLPRSSAFPAVPSSTHPIEIPHVYIFAFYEACYHFGLISDAASIYVHLFSSGIRQHHKYPPPRSFALFWLFEHFADPGISVADDGRPSFKGHIRMARTILKELVTNRIDIPIVDRPRFIAVAAARGFGFYARQLWEMYTVEDDPNRDAVRGSAQMLVPLVKLFHKLQIAWDKTVERQRSAVTKERKSVTASHKANVFSSTEVARFHNAQIMDLSGSTKISILPGAWRFANQVLTSYISAKRPLALASQEDLNALARAYIILNQIQEGLEVLNITIERGDIPDSKDINVALGAIARYSPKRAALMLHRMVKSGVGPSASAFGVVLHAALKNKEVKLVSRLVLWARRLGHGELTPKTIAAMVQSLVSFKPTTDPLQRHRDQSNLRAVLELMETVIDGSSTRRRSKDHRKDHVLSVQMGQMCIEAALKLQDPALSMKFWRLLVKERVMWKDEEAQRTRASISDCIRTVQSQNPEEFHDEAAREMLEELGPREQGNDLTDEARVARGLGHVG